jgi:hypothetical protein
MPVERHRHLHLQERNRGLRRLQILTRSVTVAMAALTALFAGLAAASNSGRKHVAAKPKLPVAARSPHPARAGRVPPPPSLPPLSSTQLQASSPPPPAPPIQAPAQTDAPPVAVSGGS